MAYTEIAELVKSNNMYEIACKTSRNLAMSEDERTIASGLDTYFKKVGETGNDKDQEIAAFVKKVVNEELYEAPDELLDAIFDRNDIGEFDDLEVLVDPKNTLIAYAAAKEGNVPRSYIDARFLTPTWANKQVETELKMAELRRNGWKSVAKLTEYAVAALKNTMFKEIFTAIDNAITSGDNYLLVSGSSVTQAAIDALTLYVNDRTDDGYMVSLSKYAQQASKLTGFNSEAMLNEIHRTGRLGVIDGVSVYPISSAKKLGDNSLLIPDRRIFGIAAKIGVLSMKGEVRVLEETNINTETIHLKFADFTFGYAFKESAIENVFKVAFSS